MALLTEDSRSALRFLAKWIVLALVAGLVASVMVRLFVFLLFLIRGTLDGLAPFPPVWAVIGALLAGLVIYRISPASVGEGIPSYLEGMNHHRGVLGLRQTIFKFWAALITLGTFGSGGIVGPLGRVSAGILSELNRRLSRLTGAFTPADTHTAAICGFAATTGAIFHAPIGSGIFAVEVIQRTQLRYHDLFPAIMAGSAAVYLSNALGWEALYDFSGAPVLNDYRVAPLILLTALACGLLGKGYNELYRGTAMLFSRQRREHLTVKLVIGMGVATTLTFMINPELMSVSEKLVPAIVNGQIGVLRGRIPVSVSIPMVFGLLLLAKAVATTITVGSGMSAGFVGPTALVGMLASALIGSSLGVVPESVEYTALLASGFAAMLASTINVPIAAAVLTLELFGLSYSFPAAVSAVIGYQINRFNTLYDYATQEEFERGGEGG